MSSHVNNIRAQRTTTERLRSNHIDTLELLQESNNENTELHAQIMLLKQKIERYALYSSKLDEIDQIEKEKQDLSSLLSEKESEIYMGKLSLVKRDKEIMNLTTELRNVKASSYDAKKIKEVKDREEMLLKQLEEANLSIETKEKEVCAAQLQIRSLEEGCVAHSNKLKKLEDRTNGELASNAELVSKMDRLQSENNDFHVKCSSLEAQLIEMLKEKSSHEEEANLKISQLKKMLMITKQDKEAVEAKCSSFSMQLDNLNLQVNELLEKIQFYERDAKLRSKQEEERAKEEEVEVGGGEDNSCFRYTDLTSKSVLTSKELQCTNCKRQGINKPVFDDKDDDDDRQIGFGEFVKLRKENKQLRLQLAAKSDKSVAQPLNGNNYASISKKGKGEEQGYALSGGGPGLRSTTVDSICSGKVRGTAVPASSAISSKSSRHKDSSSTSLLIKRSSTTPPRTLIARIRNV